MRVVVWCDVTIIFTSVRWHEARVQTRVESNSTTLLIQRIAAWFSINTFAARTIVSVLTASGRTGGASVIYHQSKPKQWPCSILACSWPAAKSRDFVPVSCGRYHIFPRERASFRRRAEYPKTASEVDCFKSSWSCLEASFRIWLQKLAWTLRTLRGTKRPPDIPVHLMPSARPQLRAAPQSIVPQACHSAISFRLVPGKTRAQENKKLKHQTHCVARTINVPIKDLHCHSENGNGNVACNAKSVAFSKRYPVMLTLSSVTTKRISCIFTVTLQCIVICLAVVT